MATTPLVQTHPRRAVPAAAVVVGLLFAAPPARAQPVERITLGATASEAELDAALRESVAAASGPRLECSLCVAPPVSLDLKVRFAFDSSVVAAEWQPALDRLARVMNRDGIREHRFRVEGHTDAVGTADYNQRLSERRARAVTDYLARRGVQADRLDALGHGESRLIDGLPGDDGRQRRVEFTALR